MKLRIKSPFDGGPVTREETDANGHRKVTVRLAATTPWCAKIADRLAAIGVVALGGWALVHTAQSIDATQLIWGGAMAVPVLSWPLFRFSLFTILRKRVVCEFTAERFRYSTFWGWNRFDRDLPHKFALIAHDRAVRERERLTFLERKRSGKWWAWAPKRYYGEAFHLSFDYLDQRNDIMTIYGRKRALAFLARLKACDEVIDARMRRGDGIALKPRDDWSTQPGSLPEAP